MFGSPVDAIFDFSSETPFEFAPKADRPAVRLLDIDRNPAATPYGELDVQNQPDAMSMSESVATDGIHGILQHVTLCPHNVGFSTSLWEFHGHFARLTVSTHSEKIGTVCCSFAALPKVSLCHICYGKKSLYFRKTVAISCVQVAPIASVLSICGQR